MVKKKKFFILAIFTVCLFFKAVSLLAEPQIEPVVVDGDKVEYSDDEKIVHAVGHCVVKYRDLTMTADKISFDVEKKQAFAEGNVFLYKNESTFKGDHGYYDFNIEKGALSDVSFVSKPVYGAGVETKKTAEKTFIAKKGYFTTCPFEKPHYRIQTKNLKIYLDDKVVANQAIFYIGDIPFIYLPYYSYSLKDNRPRVVITPGHSKEWGSYVLTAWRYYLNDGFRGRIHLDYREKKGAAEGFTHTYKTKDYGEGIIDGYYTQERLKELPESLVAEFERFRVKASHEWEPAEDIRFFAEYNRQSDTDFNEDYFYREYEKDKQPETQISLTKDYPSYTLKAYSHFRVNQFETVIQQQPEVSYTLSSYELGDSNFYYTNKTTFSNLNKKTANLGNVKGETYYYTTDTNVIRVDTYNQLSYPTKLPGYLKCVKFSPYAETRESFYTRDGSGAERNFFRNVNGAGYNLTTRMFKVWDLEKDLRGIKINRLRHLVTPAVDYVYRNDPTVQASLLDQFDSIDAVTTTKTYTFSLSNKLQTKWRTAEDELETVNLAGLDSWVYLSPQKEERSFSDIFFSLQIMPFRFMNFSGSTKYNWVTRDFDVFNFDLEVIKNKWTVNSGHRFVHNDYSESTFRLMYELSSKWKMGFYERYDFTRQKLNEQEYFFARDFHDWIIEVDWNIKESESILVVFKNKAFLASPLESELSYHEPKLGSK